MFSTSCNELIYKLELDAVNKSLSDMGGKLYKDKYEVLGMCQSILDGKKRTANYDLRAYMQSLTENYLYFDNQFGMWVMWLKECMEVCKKPPSAITINNAFNTLNRQARELTRNGRASQTAIKQYNMLVENNSIEKCIKELEIEYVYGRLRSDFICDISDEIPISKYGEAIFSSNESATRKIDMFIKHLETLLSDTLQ